MGNTLKRDLIIREISGKDAGWADAVEMATIVMYSFRDSPRVIFGKPPLYRFNGDLLRPIYAITDPLKRLDALVYRASAFRDSIHMQALLMYKKVTRPNARAWIAYDPVDNAPLGLSLWAIPEQFEKQTFLSRVIDWFVSVQNSLARSYLRLTRPRNSVYVPKMYDSLGLALDSLGLDSSPEKEKALATSASPGSLKYPAKYAYELVYFCVTRQGSGFGSQLFEQTLGKIETSMRPVKVCDEVLPPQALIVSTPEGCQLYQKYGFEKVDEVETGTEEKEPYKFTEFRKSYPKLS